MGGTKGGRERPEGREGVKVPRMETGGQGDEWREEGDSFRGLGSEGVRAFVARTHKTRVAMTSTGGFRARMPLDLDNPLPPLTDDERQRAWVRCLQHSTGMRDLTLIEDGDRIGPSFLVQGTLAGTTVVALLDSGSETNLVSRSFMEGNAGRIQVHEGQLVVRFGDNAEEHTTGELRGLSFEAQGAAFRIPVINVSPVEMRDVDLILGTPFLQQTGGGLFTDPLPRLQFPDGGSWWCQDQFEGPRSAANIKCLHTERDMRRFLAREEGKLDQYMVRIRNVSAGELRSAGEERKIDPRIQALLDEFHVGIDRMPHAVEREQGVDMPEAFLNIPLKDGARPQRSRPLPMSSGEKLVLQSMLAELLEKGYIEETDGSSGWSAPVFLIRKPGTREGNLQQFRLIVDMRALNKLTETASYVPPNIAELVKDLQGSSVFSSTDLLSGYFQMTLAPESRAATGFACGTPEGVRHYQFRVACLGLSGAAAGFQQFSEAILRGTEAYIIPYLDDFLVHTKDEESHVTALRTLFQRLQQAKVFINPAKCTFRVEKIEFLGLLISKDKMEISDSKRPAL